MAGSREIRARQRAGLEEPSDGALSVQVGEDARYSSLPAPALSDIQLQITECLRETRKSLTVKQLETRVLCPAEALEVALASLVQRRLVARLNTIIPTYVLRSEAAQGSTE